MRLPSFSTDPLLRLLQAKKIAPLPDLQHALGSQVPLTMFRKLKELGSRTSYSHRGRFYTLDRIARFDRQGLWSHDSVFFSRYGTLVIPPRPSSTVLLPVISLPNWRPRSTCPCRTPCCIW